MFTKEVVDPLAKQLLQFYCFNAANRNLGSEARVGFTISLLYKIITGTQINSANRMVE